MKKRHNRLSALLLSMFMCISSVTLPVYAQDAGTEAPVPEQEPETEVIVSEEEPAETEEEAGEPEEETEEITVSEPEEPVIEEEPEPAPEEPAEVQEAEEEETDSSVFADESWILRIELGTEEVTLDGWDTETVYDNSVDYINLPGRPTERDGYAFVGWALDPVEDRESYGGTVYYDGEGVSASVLLRDGSRTATIYAVWAEEREFQLNYHFNAENAKFSGMDETKEVFVRTETWTRGDAYLEYPEAPGKVFLGWAFTADATEKDTITEKDICEQYWDDAADVAVVHIYGVWRESAKYVINYEAGENAAFANGATTRTQEMSEGPTSGSGNLRETVIYDIPVNNDSSLVFKEWKVEKDDASVVYRGGDYINKKSADFFGVNDGSVTTLTLTAVFEEGETYTAIFHVGEGVTVSGSGVEKVSDGVYRSTFTSFDVNEGRSLPTEEFNGYKPLWTLERKGCYTSGWYKGYKDDTFEGEPYYSLADLFNGTTPEDVELWLNWYKMEYPVIYYPNLEGARPIGNVLSDNSYVPQYFVFDADVILDQTFVHPEYFLKGWNTDKAKAEKGVVEYRNGQNIGKYFENTENPLRVYGVWVKDTNQKHVYYDPIYGDVEDIGGQLSAAGWFTHVFQKSDVVTVNQECIREGYVLRGWNTDRTKAENGIVQYRNGDSLGKYFAKGADNLILYAVWRDASIGGEVIYYPAIDGALREDGTEIRSFQSERVPFGADEDVEINMAFTHPDFTLQGWATSEANADKGIIAYSNGDELTKYFAEHDDNLVLYAVWKQDFGTVIYHPNRSGAAPVDKWLSQSGYQTKSFRRDENVIINQEMIHPSYVLIGWATTKKKADSGKIDYENGKDLGKYFADKDELVLYGVWKAGKGLITSVTIPEQTVYGNWNASEDALSYSPDYSSYNLTPASITVKAGGKTYKGTPEEVAADIKADTGTEVSVEVRDEFASEDYIPKTAKLKLNGIETSFKIKFVKDPVTVTIPDGAKIFMDDLDENEEYNFLPEKMTVKIGKKTYTGDFETVAEKLASAQHMGMNISEWENWDRTQHAIELHSEKYAGRGRGYAMYPYSTEFIEGPIASITADDIDIQAAGDYSVFYNTHGNLVEGSVTKDRLVDAVYMTVTLEDGSTIEGQLADINKQLDEKYGAHYRNARLEGTGTTRRLVLGNCHTMLDVSEPQFPAKEKVAVGKSITLKPASTVKTPVWTSVESAVAKVTSKGKVTGVKEGVTMVHVVDKKTGMQMEHWYVEVVPAANVVDIRYRGTDDNYHGSVSGRTLKLDEDGFALKSAVYPENAIQEVTWTSSNNEIATIAEDGAVTRLKNGTVTFTAKAKDGTGKKASVKVTFATFVEDLQITGPAEVAAGKKVTLKTVATGINGKTPTNKAVTWKSSDPSIAKISSKGVVTAVKGKEGQSVTITAIAKDREGRVDEVLQTFTLNVTAPVTSVKLKDPAGEYINGKTVKVSGSSYTITPEVLGNPGNELKWTSAKTSVAEVDQNGVVTKKKNGTVNITAAATDGTGKKATVTLKFTD